MAEDVVKPDIPYLEVLPVTNGYVVRVGFRVRDGFIDERPTYVARTHAELCRLLKHIAVRDKLS